MIKITLDISGPEKFLEAMETKMRKLAEMANRQHMLKDLDDVRRQLGMPQEAGVLRKHPSIMYEKEGDAREAAKSAEKQQSMAEAHNFARDLEAWVLGGL